jgi:hypothetical protein
LRMLLLFCAVRADRNFALSLYDPHRIGNIYK